MVTGDSDRWRDLHVFAGYLMLALVGFRVLWGFAGTRYARFASFPFSPRRAFGYARSLLRGDAARFIGHNPAGSVAIYALGGAGLRGVRERPGGAGQRGRPRNAARPGQSSAR